MEKKFMKQAPVVWLHLASERNDRCPPKCWENILTTKEIINK